MRLRLTHYGADVVMATSLVCCVGVGLTSVYFLPALPIVALVWLWVLYFFRDPNRRVPEDAAALLAPADGKIVAVERTRDLEDLPGECWRVDIFLSIFNVHINRAPCSGSVERISYRKGEFLNALRAEAAARNERNDVLLRTPSGVPVLVRQIAGVIARRIVCDCVVGDSLERGERFGMIRFGSRTELYIPVDAVKELCVSLGRHVRAGTTILGELR